MSEPRGDWSCREAMGSLMWLPTMMVSDISNAVRAVARHSHNPTGRHWKEIMKIMAYLHGTTQGFGIHICEGFGIGSDWV